MKLYYVMNATYPALQGVGRHQLISYYYFWHCSHLLANLSGLDLIIDSGAYSAWTQHKRIRVRDYANFCLKMQEILGGNLKYLIFVNLDVIPTSRHSTDTEASAEESYYNYLYLKKDRGLDPLLYVFHEGEDFKWLEKIKTKETYIGLSPDSTGALHRSQGQEIRNWLKKCFSVLGRGYKTHSFGYLSPRLLTEFPFYSADSALCLLHSAYGVALTYEQFKIKCAHANRKDLASLKMPYKLVGRGRQKTQERFLHNLKAQDRLEDDLTRLWAERGITWDAEEA